MSRGHVFHISTDPNQLYELSMYDCNDTFMQSLCEFYSHDGKIQTSDDLYTNDEMMDIMRNRGLPVTKVAAPCDNDSTILYQLQVTSEQMDAYFGARLTQLHDKLSKLSLDDFKKPSVADTLVNMIDNDCEDIVLMNDVAYTFDRFLRHIESEQTYYIHPETLLMH